MYLGIRDILYAKGRFALIATVIALITLLLVMLTGLTGGLGAQNTSALTALGADRMVFGPAQNGEGADAGKEEAKVSFTDSDITQQQARHWQGVDGVSSAIPVGFAQTQLAAQSSGAASVLGVPDGSSTPADAAGSARQGSMEIREGGVVVSQTLADDLGASLGRTVSLGGQELTVTGVARDEFYAHGPVAWVDTAAWQQISHAASGGSDPVVGTMLAVHGALDDDAWSAAAADTGTTTATTRESFSGLPAYSSEHGSLLTMQGFLYGISALVTVSFLTVWTIQRTRDIAVLRALGASGGYLMRDAVGQAAIVLAVGVAVGTGLAVGLGALASHGVPFRLDVATTVGPAAGIWILGLIGSLFAVRRVARIDPMIALGGN